MRRRGVVGLAVVGGYTVLAVALFWPGLLPGHTLSAADLLVNSAPWNSGILHGMVPRGFPADQLHPLSVGANLQLNDGVTVFEPFLQFTRASLPHVPLWDPYILGGAPFLADLQSAIFSPFNVPAYVLPLWWSLGVIAVMKVVVAATGMYALSRLLSMSRGGAFLSGLVFGFGLFMIAWIPWPLTNVFPLMPWLLVATELLIRKPDLLRASGLALVVGMQWFGGHPETSVYALGLVGVLVAVRCVSAERRIAVVVLAGGGLVVGTLLAGVVLLPFDEFLRQSADLATRPRNAVHIPTSEVLAMFLPSYYPGTFTIVTGLSVGTLPLMLGTLGAMRWRADRIAVAIIAGGSLAVALGIQPLFWLAGHTPGLDATYLSRISIVFLLGMAILAGWGLDDLMAKQIPVRRIGAVAGGLLALPLVVVAWNRGIDTGVFGRAVSVGLGFSNPPHPTSPDLGEVVHTAAVVRWVVVGAAAAIVLVLAVRGRRRRLVVGLAIALAAVDLITMGFGYNPGIPTSHAAQPATGAVRYLERQGTARYVGVQRFEQANPLPPDVDLDFGLYDLRGYDLPLMARFGDLWRRDVTKPNPLLPTNTPSVALTVDNGISPAGVRILDLYGVRSIIEQVGVPAPAIRGLRRSYDGPDAVIYTLASALPRTWLVDHQRIVAGTAAELSTLTSRRFAPRRTAMVSARISGLGHGPPGHSRITEYSPTRVTIEADARTSSLLILSDSWFPGWTATVNGRPVPIDRVDYTLRGVEVPRGHDTVVFTYAPQSFRDGLVTTLIGAAALVGAVGLSLVRRRRRNVRHRIEASYTRRIP